MIDNNIAQKSPLSSADIETIESTNLSSIERHYLRLLAHCLACFKQMSDGSTSGELPNAQHRMKWVYTLGNTKRHWHLHLFG